MKKAVPVIIAIALIFLIGAITFGMKVLEHFSYSKERMDLNGYFGRARRTRPPCGHGEGCSWRQPPS